MKAKLRKRMDKMPLWAEFTLFLAVILILLTVILFWTVYKREEGFITESRVRTEHELLTLKMTNLEDYLDSLSAFAILPVYDSSFYSAMLSTGELSDETVEMLRSKVRTWFYSRGDLKSYHVNLLNHDLSVGRSYNDEGIRILTVRDMEDSEACLMCEASSRNYCLFPSEHPDVPFKFVHSIIKIENKKTVALTEIEPDLSGVAYLSSTGLDEDEILSLYSSHGELLYSNAGGELRDAITGYSVEDNRRLIDESISDRDITLRTLRETDYLTTSVTGAGGELVLVSMVPVSDVLSQLRNTGKAAVLTGLIFLIFSLVAAFLLIRYLSAPLSALVKIQENFGEGEVADVNLGRSRESAELSRSFNRMTRRIDMLIKENYAAELNEKSAYLAALEAQVNPHFLYNTLQAIGSEALLNDQTAIYDMLTTLASNLRYSIKASNVVCLKDELKYVDDYIMLQKIRMGERLVVRKNISPVLMDFEVPKLCIQTLVENSITHGIGGGKSAVVIDLTVSSEKDSILIRVLDDGVGIDEENLKEIRQSLRSQTLSDSNQSIGLANLYNRLLILYGDEMDMSIDSKAGEASYTLVRLKLPTDKSRPEEGSETDNA